MSHGFVLNTHGVNLQSCKRLDSVSRSLSVWREQYAAFIALNPSTPPLESPLELYSSRELETMVLRCGSVDAGWHSATEDPVSMRIIPFKNADLAETHLVDGGRWLLASGFGIVMVYDLDDPRDEGKILIPRYADAHENLRTTALNVDILTTAPTLTFNLAISQDLPGTVIDQIFCPGILYTNALMGSYRLRLYSRRHPSMDTHMESRTEWPRR